MDRGGVDGVSPCPMDSRVPPVCQGPTKSLGPSPCNRGSAGGEIIRREYSSHSLIGRFMLDGPLLFEGLAKYINKWWVAPTILCG